MRLAAYQMVAAPGDVPRNLADDHRSGRTGEGGGGRHPGRAGARDDRLRHRRRPSRAWPKSAEGVQATVLATAAARLGIAIVAGFAERAGDAVYNAALLATPSGARHVYRKCQLYGDYEKRRFARGPVAPEVFDVGGVRIGILICFDVEFPEHVRRLAARRRRGHRGADRAPQRSGLPHDPGPRHLGPRLREPDCR